MRRMLSMSAIRVPRIPAWATMFLLLPLLAVLPAVPVDETRYLSIAWEMRRSGELLTLHLNGAPYFDKPPLLFWLINVFWSVFGITTWAARAVSVFFAAGCVALVSRLERCLAGAAADEAPWLLAGFVYFALFACVAMFDIGLSFFILLAFLALVRRVQHGGGSLLLLFAAVSLGVLMKGPVVLLHLGGPVALIAWWGREAPTRRWTWYAATIAVVLAGVLPAALWAWLAVRGIGPDAAYELFFQQTAGRVVDSFAHRRGVLWYLPFLPLILLPWPLLLRWGRARSVVREAMATPACRFGMAACVPALVAFSAVSGKQLHYLLPLYPGAALFLGAMLRVDRQLLSLRRLVVFWLSVAGLLIWAWLRNHSLEATPVAWLAWVIGAALFATVAAAWIVRRTAPAAALKVSGFAEALAMEVHGHLFRHRLACLGLLAIALAVVVLGLRRVGISWGYSAGYAYAVLMLVTAGMLAIARHGPAQVVRLSVASLLLVGAMLPALRTLVFSRYDLDAFAGKVAELAHENVPMARTGDEPGLVTYLARLGAPLPTTDDPRAWASSHPHGYILTWSPRRPPVPGLMFGAPIGRRGWVGLVSAGAWAPQSQAPETLEDDAL